MPPASKYEHYAPVQANIQWAEMFSLRPKLLSRLGHPSVYSGYADMLSQASHTQQHAQVFMTLIAPSLELFPDSSPHSLISLHCRTESLCRISLQPWFIALAPCMSMPPKEETRDPRESRLQVGISDISLAHVLRRLPAAIHSHAQQNCQEKIVLEL